MHWDGDAPKGKFDRLEEQNNFVSLYVDHLSIREASRWLAGPSSSLVRRGCLVLVMALDVAYYFLDQDDPQSKVVRYVQLSCWIKLLGHLKFFLVHVDVSVCRLPGLSWATQNRLASGLIIWLALSKDLMTETWTPTDGVWWPTKRYCSHAR
jgi:hypothetical protein